MLIWKLVKIVNLSAFLEQSRAGSDYIHIGAERRQPNFGLHSLSVRVIVIPFEFLMVLHSERINQFIIHSFGNLLSRILFPQTLLNLLFYCIIDIFTKLLSCCYFFDRTLLYSWLFIVSLIFVGSWCLLFVISLLDLLNLWVIT